MTQTRHTDWASVIGGAQTAFGLAPAQTWGLSLVEWRALCAAARQEPTLSRAQFDDLAAAYPDTPAAQKGSNP